MTTAEARLVKHIEGGFGNPCEAHDGAHLFETIEIDGIPFDLFSAEKYRDTPGYCPADDTVSRTIKASGQWEQHVTKIFDTILTQPHTGIVIDIGAHVGWYARRALNQGWTTVAVEANGPTFDLLCENAAMSKNPKQFYGCHGWIDEAVTPFPYELKIKVIKMDIEGNEQHAFHIFEPLFRALEVEYCIMEVSPVFNSSYHYLLQRMLRIGYKCWRIDQRDKHDEWTLDNYTDKLAEFDQVDVLWQSPNAEKLWN